PARLLQDLMFFCAQAKPREQAGESLQAVHEAYSMEFMPLVDYNVARFGRFDPSVLVQARKRIAAAAETWSALAGGDRSKIKSMAEQFGHVSESLVKLQPASHGLARALIRVAETVDSVGAPPPAELAMEVATAVLYLQASFMTAGQNEEVQSAQSSVLVHRLDAALNGAVPEPLEVWMEELYRQASDQQTMGSVVGELRLTLGEAEKQLDMFFRNPADTSVLGPVPGQMSQMRGVLSVLGFDQAAMAMQRMRETVERLMLGELSVESYPQVFEKLGSSLGAMGFLIDMLSYQRNMARKLFVYDEEKDELRIVMGHSRSRGPEAFRPTVDIPTDIAQVPDFKPAPPVGAVPVEAPVKPADAEVAQAASLQAGAQPSVAAPPPPPEVTPAIQAPVAAVVAPEFLIPPEVHLPAVDEVAAGQESSVEDESSLWAVTEPGALPEFSMTTAPAELDMSPVGSDALADAMAQVFKGMQTVKPSEAADAELAHGLNFGALVEPAPVSAAPIPAPVPAPVAQVVELSAEDLDGDDELLSIFLEEAREVVDNGLNALKVLAYEPENLSEQTTLRRAFHTLKGSSRMVGLDEFGEAGWSMEQMLNAWLAEQQPMPALMQLLAQDSLKAFAAWAQDIENRQAENWSATPFRAAADAMRLQGTAVDIALVPRRGKRAEQADPVPDAPGLVMPELDFPDDELTPVAQAELLVEPEEAAADFAMPELDIPDDLLE
ncbi:MAG: Hpt domain-containing protein, partial [Comamonas sp.]